MKLLNKSIAYFSVSLLVIISIWAVVFYFNMLDEIKRSIDEGLDNYKRQIVYESQKDSTVLKKNNFDEGFFAIRKISHSQALQIKDTYIDTLMMMQDADDEAPELEPVRLLTTAFESNKNYYKLQIINPMVEEDDLVKELLYDAGWLYLILIISIILLNNLVLKRLWNPFYSFLNQLKKYRIGTDVNHPKTNTTTTEFNDLENAVAILLQRVSETYEQQKQFIGNASHELQTPLAITTNKLELLIENGNLNNEQAQNIEEVMSIIQRLIRLNKSLLLLTKIENKQFLDNATISLNEIVKQNIDDLDEIAKFRFVEILLVENAQLETKMEASLANSIVSNLLKNALYYNMPNGTITIEIFEKSIRFSNSGSAHSLDTEKVFSRFYKSENNDKGTGLGLAIVKAICTLYGFTITYDFLNSQHTFEIKVK